jgi:hypothetical protein
MIPPRRPPQLSGEFSELNSRRYAHARFLPVESPARVHLNVPSLTGRFDIAVIASQMCEESYRSSNTSLPRR